MYRLTLVAEIESATSEKEAQAKLDAFREAVTPGQYGIFLFRAAAGPYWLNWVDDSGNPRDNDERSGLTAGELADDLAAIMKENNETPDRASLLGTIENLGTPGQKDVDLAYGRLYFGRS